MSASQRSGLAAASQKAARVRRGSSSAARNQAAMAARTVPRRGRARTPASRPKGRHQREPSRGYERVLHVRVPAPLDHLRPTDREVPTVRVEARQAAGSPTGLPRPVRPGCRTPPRPRSRPSAGPAGAGGADRSSARSRGRPAGAPRLDRGAPGGAVADRAAAVGPSRSVITGGGAVMSCAGSRPRPSTGRPGGPGRVRPRAAGRSGTGGCRPPPRVPIGQ